MFIKTPVQILANREPVIRNIINKMSSKWTKRTKAGVIKWPEGRTFDIEICEKMKTLILHYKSGDKNQRRKDKQSAELMVLAKFFREACRRKQKMEEKVIMKRPPPYATPQATLGKRAEIDPPPWHDSKRLYPKLSKEEGMFPIVEGIFKANLQITEEQDPEMLVSDQTERESQVEEKNETREEQVSNETPASPTCSKKHSKRPPKTAAIRHDLDAKAWFYEHEDRPPRFNKKALEKYRSTAPSRKEQWDEQEYEDCLTEDEDSDYMAATLKEEIQKQTQECEKMLKQIKKTGKAVRRTYTRKKTPESRSEGEEEEMTEKGQSNKKVYNSQTGYRTRAKAKQQLT